MSFFRLVYLLESYKGTEKIMGVLLSAAYIVAKGSDILQRVKFLKRSFIKFLQKTVRLHILCPWPWLRILFLTQILVFWHNSNKRADSSSRRDMSDLPRQLPGPSHSQRVQSYFLWIVFAGLAGPREQYLPTMQSKNRSRQPGISRRFHYVLYPVLLEDTKIKQTYVVRKLFASNAIEKFIEIFSSWLQKSGNEMEKYLKA
jgi:hypothetical protein